MAATVPDDNCRSIRERYRAGQIVEAVVVEHRHFGFFVDLGHPDCLGVVLIHNIEDRPPRPDAPMNPRPLRPGEVRLGPRYPIYPALGSSVRCVLLGFATFHDGRAQPRLSMRPSHLKWAAAQLPS